MARTPRTFPGRGHSEAKAGENTRQGKSREDVTEQRKQTAPQHEFGRRITELKSEPLCGNA